MFELKEPSSQGIERALEKVERHRLLNEPWEAESICRDVLEADPENREALISLLLSLTDQFDHQGAPSADEVRGLLSRLDGDYERAEELRPPGNDDALDAAVMHRVAEASVQRFVQDVATYLREAMAGG